VYRRLILVVLAVVCVVSGGHAQVPVHDTTATHDSLSAPLRVVATDTLSHPAVQRKSTWMAMGFSAILPGAGQVYNESYWKAPLVFGLGVYFMAEVLRNNRTANDYRQLYFATQDPVDIKQRDYYKDQRDTNLWYFFIVYVLNIVDAYVDASLYGFDVTPTLSYRSPAGTVGLSLRVGF
jgi:hypothetical protein